MGVSTNAILFWGIELGEENPLEEDPDAGADDTDAAAMYALKKEGLKEPEEEFSHEDEKILNLYKDYWDKRNKIHDAAGCEHDIHCSCDYPMHYAAVTESVTTARRGSPEEITSLVEGHDWREKLRDYCETLGIPWQEPKWWLVSLWC
jgi:hypothetical protein